MSIQNKPDYKVFASDAKSGEIETFPDIPRGWGVTIDRTGEIPPMEWFNAIGKRVDEWLLYLTQRGVPEWDASLDYPKAAMVQYAGIYYVSLKATKAEQPNNSQASWSTLGAFLGLGNYYNKTESDTKYQPKGNYAPAGDYATNTALNNGLDKKFNKTGGTITGAVTVNSSMMRISGVDDWPGLSIRKTNGEEVRVEATNATGTLLDISYRDTENKRLDTFIIPRKSGTAMLVGDYGVGVSLTQLYENYTSTTLGCGFYAMPGGGDNPWGSNGSAHILNVRDRIYGFQIGKTTGAESLSYRILDNGSFSEKAVIHSTANTITDRNGNIKASWASDNLTDYPVGSPIPWPKSTAPSGFLVCNGQSFNKTSYPLLASAYPSGVLPDLRGEFIRGLDAGRNIDSGRVVLEPQRDSMRKLEGQLGFQSDKLFNTATGVFAGVTSSSNMSVQTGNDTPTSTAIYSSIKFDNSNVTYTTNETRPRNIAFLYIVRAA